MRSPASALSCEETHGGQRPDRAAGARGLRTAAGDLGTGAAHINLPVPTQSARASAHRAHRSAGRRACPARARPRLVVSWRTVVIALGAVVRERCLC